MNEKYMKIKKIILPTLTIALMSSQLLGCSALSQSELLKLINQGQEIEIEIAVPVDAEQANDEMLTWIVLASLTSNPDLRAQWDDTLKITVTADGKNGCIYVDTAGNNENNNTLRIALHNREFLKALEDEKTMEALAKAAELAYTDIDSEDNQQQALAIALNGYFNLLPDSGDGSANPNDAITRMEFMTMVTRGETPVEDNVSASESFISAVGNNGFTAFAERVVGNSYLDLSSKSLNNRSFTNTMSRAEAIYLLVSRYFSNELSSVDTKGVTFSDCKDGGNIAEKQKFIEKGNVKDYYRDYEMVYAIQNPDDGLPTELYKAMVVAKNKGLIGDETRWDEGITKAEAIQLIIDTYKKEAGIEVFSYSRGNSGTEANTENIISESEDNNVEYEDHSIVDEDEKLAIEDYLSEGTRTDSEFKVTDVSKKMWSNQDCNVRTGPSTEYTKASALAYAEEVQVTGYCEAENWYRINKDGIEGFVSARFLQDTKIEKPSTNTSNNTSGNTVSKDTNGDGYIGYFESNEYGKAAHEDNPYIDYSSGCCLGADDEGYVDLTNLPVVEWGTGRIIYDPNAQ